MEASERVPFVMPGSWKPAPFCMHRKDNDMAEKKKSTKKETVKKAEEKQVESFKARVVRGNLNIRVTPEMKDGNIVGLLKDGEVVTITGRSEELPFPEWYLTDAGWIKAEFVEILDADPEEEE